MKTTVDIPDQTLKDAMRFLKTKTKRDAIVFALEELNRRHRLAHLSETLGTFTGFMTQDELRAARRRA